MDFSIELMIVLIPALPLAAAVLTAVLGPLLQRADQRLLVAAPTIVALAASFLVSLALVNEINTLQTGGDQGAKNVERVVNLWTWAAVEGAYDLPLKPPSEASSAVQGGPRDFIIDVVLRADALTAMMLVMVTFVSTLVAVYSMSYMDGDRGFWRFFSYISLFVFSMTMLVSVSNFILLFVFWEAVGVCSYLLIGFWYEKPDASAAGMKAFLVNRVGDFGFTLAVFLIWTTYGTVNFHDTAIIDGVRAPVTDLNRMELTRQGVEIEPGVLGLKAEDYVAGATGLAICLLLLIGACGKSAQLPLHVWLPDAMEGPTPVSALIHAATMVTAGVYMVTRCTPLFMVSPQAQLAVASIGGLTALIAGLIALTQFDLKRVLAYSTISQLGYMFLALGTGTLAGVTAGMFHLFTHAFFKALLFLGAGSVMHAMGNVIDMRRFGGLSKIMPITRWTCLIGCLALAGVFPLAGFWSKDGVVASVHDKVHDLEHRLEHRHEHPTEHQRAAHGVDSLSDETLEHFKWAYGGLYYLAMFTALLTAFYTFRAYLLTFHGETHVPREAHGHAHESPAVMTVPLVVLAVCAVVAGFFFDRTALPEYMRPEGSPAHLFADFISRAPQLSRGAITETVPPGEFHLPVAGVSLFLALLGIAGAMFLYLGGSRELRLLNTVMRFQWMNKAMGAESVSWLNRVPGRIAGYIYDGFRGYLPKALHAPLDEARDFLGRICAKSGIAWLGALLGNVVLLLFLVLMLPLMMLTYVSPYRLSYRKFYFDELYAALLVRPVELLARVCFTVDRLLVDGLVNLVGRIPPAVGSLMRSMQTGLVQFYAVIMMIGAALLFLVKVFVSS